MTGDAWTTATAVLRLAAELVDGVQRGLAARGFDDVRPVHGFAFARLAGGPASTAQLAQHLGITKQAAGEVVEHLVNRGYVTREPDPTDRRARLLVLTRRGHECTHAAEQAAADVVGSWRERLPPARFDALTAALHGLAVPGRLRPAW